MYLRTAHKFESRYRLWTSQCHRSWRISVDCRGWETRSSRPIARPKSMLKEAATRSVGPKRPHYLQILEPCSNGAPLQHRVNFIIGASCSKMPVNRRPPRTARSDQLHHSRLGRSGPQLQRRNRCGLPTRERPPQHSALLLAQRRQAGHTNPSHSPPHPSPSLPRHVLLLLSVANGRTKIRRHIASIAGTSDAARHEGLRAVRQQRMRPLNRRTCNVERNSFPQPHIEK